MPLHGRVLIEASAGTGKTFTIGLVFLRLLLERGLRVEQILVATFTDRAAQELRERLRARLIEAEQILRRIPSKDSADEVSLQSWLESFRRDEGSMKQALRRVQLARADLDRAPIGTIHSICQRILRDHPLETGATLLPEKLTDQNTLLRECVEDFWRKRYFIGAVDADESNVVVERGIESLIADVRGLVDVDAKILPLGDPSTLHRDVETLRNVDHAVTLRAWSANKTLYGKSKRALSARFVEFAEVIEANGDILAVLTDRSADYLDPPKFAEQLSDVGKQLLFEHSLIVLLRRVRSAATQKRAIRGRVLSDALAFCREEIPHRARIRNVQTFSMLIDTVHARLCADANRAFADVLFEAYPAALIDEFQDTDNRQFEIFDRIYRDRGLLTMIGDPKQAIYAFRGGDIAAYLRARRSAQAQFALTVNQRSSTELVRAINSLYAKTDGGFNDADIRYRQAQASGTADATAYRFGPNIIRCPLSIHRFLRDVDAGANVSEQDERALDDCAARIVELLNDAQYTIGGNRAVPGDIAVLVTTNQQIASLRRRLVARGVPCVGTGRGNVFDSDITRDLELVLHAVLNSGDDRAVRGALCTRLLGATLSDVRRWQSDEQAFELELERFAEWHALARLRGVQALVQTVVASRAGELLALADGDRIITDLRHLSELLVDDTDASQGLRIGVQPPRRVAPRRRRGRCRYGEIKKAAHRKRFRARAAHDDPLGERTAIPHRFFAVRLARQRSNRFAQAQSPAFP